MTMRFSPLARAIAGATLLLSGVAQAQLAQNLTIGNPKAMAMILQKADQGQSLDYITEASRFFERILVVPSFNDGFRAHWLTPRDLGAAVGLQVRQNLRDSAGDFVLQGPADHGVAGLMNLFGIESPGLTSSLALADEVLRRLAL